MSLLHLDSFDHYATAQLLAKYSATGSAEIVSDQSRFGGRSLWFNAYFTTGYVTFDLVGLPSTVIVGAAVLVGNLSAQGTILTLYDGATEQVSCALSGSGHIAVGRGGSTFGISTAAISAGTWNYLELKVTIADSGSYEVRLNGVTILSGSADTKASANAYATTVRLNAASSGGSWVDDLYICDGAGGVNDDFLGDVRAQTLLPVTDATGQDWSPSTGTDHFAVVDDVPPNGDTDYVASSTSDAVDTYQMTEVAVAAGTVFGLAWRAYARKDDAGPRTITPIVRLSGVDYEGSPQALSTSWAYYSEIFETNPVTDLAWTIDDIGSVEFGYKLG